MSLLRYLMQWPLRFFVPAALLVIALLMTAINYGAEVEMRRQSLQARAGTDLGHELHRLAGTLEYLIQRGDDDRVRHELAELGAVIGVTEAWLTDGDGVIVAATRMELVGQRIARPRPASTLGEKQRVLSEGMQLSGYQPMTVRPDENQLRPHKDGLLYIGRNLTPALTLAEAEARREAIEFGIFAVALAALMWLYFSHVVSRRLFRMERSAKHLAEGRFDIRLELEGHDELARVGQAFDHMADELEDAWSEAEQQRADLLDSNAELNALRRALDLHATVSITDPQGNIVFVNDRFCEMTGYSREELIGNSHRMLKSDAHAQSFYEDLWRTILAGDPWHGIIENRREDGSHYWIQTTIVPELDAEGAIRKYISVRTDVSRLERTRRAMETLSEIAPLGARTHESIAHAACLAFDCRWAGIALLDEAADTAHITAFWADGAPAAPFDYAMAGTPCETLGNQDEVRVIADGVAEMFPSDAQLKELGARSYLGIPLILDGKKIGQLFALDSRPHIPDNNEETILRLMARRAVMRITQEHTERQLLESEQRFRKLFEDSAQATLIIEGDHFIDCNQAALDMLHMRSPAQLVGKRPDEISPASQPDGLGSPDKAAQMIRLAHERGSHRFEWEHLRADGEHFIAEVLLTPIRHQGRHLLHVVWQDITENKKTEAAVKTASQYARSLIEASIDPLVTISPEGRIMDVNRATETATGLPREALIGSDFSSYFTDPAQASAGYRQVFEKGEVIGYPLTIRHASGSTMEVLYNATLYHDAEGNMAGIFASARDVTSLRRIEHQLSESESRLRTIIENEPECIKVVDAQGRLLEMNPAGLAMIEAESLDQVAKHQVAELITPEFREAFAQMHKQVIAGIPAVMQFELAGLKGGRRWVETHAVPMREADGKVVHLAVTRDITDRKRLEAEQERLRTQLQQAQKMEAIGQLTGGIAHDFNNILAAILGYTGLALDRFVPDKDSKLAAYLREVQTAGERARDLIAKMLAFSRGTRGGSSPIDAGPLVKEVVKTLRSVIPSSIDLEAEIADDLPAVLGDPVQLHQVLMNLAINARDAIGEHGRIAIRLHALGPFRAACDSCHHDFEGEFVELSVRDTGGGIPPEILHRIFDPFFTTKEVGKGTGMGLSMVHGILHEHGGHIRVHSVPGEGTTIRLLIPMAAREPVVSGDPGRLQTVSSPGLSARVLVVDDEATVGRMLGEVLETHGHQATVVADSTLALAQFEADPDAWDVVITDQTMPGLSGADMARRMLEIRPALPVFLCSGFSDAVNEDSAAQLGIRKYFTKPVDSRALLTALQNFLNSDAAHDKRTKP